MDPDLERFERAVAHGVRDYLKDPDAFPFLSSALQWLLQWHWDAREFPRQLSFDGVAQKIQETRDATRFYLRGVMVYFEETGRGDWIDLFEADLGLAEGGDALVDYTLRFGRRGIEDRIPYEEMKTVVKQVSQGIPWDWAYVFTPRG